MGPRRPAPDPADNSVVDGIRLIASLLAESLLFVHESCAGRMEEIPGYYFIEPLAGRWLRRVPGGVRVAGQLGT